MSAHAPHTRLRLVRPSTPVEPAAGSAPPTRDQRRAVEEANAQSAHVSDDAAHAIFSTRVAHQLEGGKVALLRPERRRELSKLATNMGIRPFDAQLLIAVTQDAARHGEIVTGDAALDPAADPSVGTRRPMNVWPVLIGSALGIAMAVFAAAWVGGGLR